MCGICFVLNREPFGIRDEIKHFLDYRGPDVRNDLKVDLDDFYLNFHGCTLWLQGESPQVQPILDDNGNILLWNGDHLDKKKAHQSDSFFISESLKTRSGIEISKYISLLEGPWSFIYFSKTAKSLYFGRDIFGRRSLLWSYGTKRENEFILTSVAPRKYFLKEVPALGIYCLDLKNVFTENKYIFLFPFHSTGVRLNISEHFNGIEVLNNSLPNLINTKINNEIPSLNLNKNLKILPHTDKETNLEYFSKDLKNEIHRFKLLFSDAVQKRINACPPKCKNCTQHIEECLDSKYAVMFSGGLDSAYIALILSNLLPGNEVIDLLNVSFENNKKNLKINKNFKAVNLEANNVNFDLNKLKAFEDKDKLYDTADRRTAINCLDNLKKICPYRKWNFVEINVTLEELQRERDKTISDLIAPHSSVLDDSIGCALYFCGRGKGLLRNNPYTTPARVLFSGLGADESLGGYSRHRGAFEKNSWIGLINEIEGELVRIHERNCGRDDRVLSHHGRVARYPFLDENLVNYLNSLEIWKKANLYLPRGIGEKLLLRLAAYELGLTFSATLPKKAIQFGSGIAKLEKSKEKGRDVCDRLYNNDNQ